MIVDGLRPQFNRTFGSSQQDPGNDADAEEYFPKSRTRERKGPKRRNPLENVLSVSQFSLSLNPRCRPKRK